MKNVLIISQFFAPENIIASIRFTKMVKYLARTKDYHFWVVCVGLNKDAIRDELLQRDVEEVAEYVTVFPVYMDNKFINKLKRLYAGRRKGKTISNKDTVTGQEKDIYYAIQKNLVSCEQKGIVGSVKRLLGQFFLAVNDIYDLAFEFSFAKRGIALSKQIPIDDIDVMISTYGQVGSLLLATKFKKIKKDLKWIVDYRDPVIAASAITKMFIDWVVFKADKKADYITGATRSCVGSGKQLKKFHIIPNGYDKEDIREICPIQNNKLTICYTGSLYYGKSDMTLLFKIIYELCEENKLDIAWVNIVYAGGHYHVLEDQAKQYGLEEILDNRGQISRKESLQIQRQSDILCALTWNSIGNDDILTGKVLEYFMMQRPIFAVVSGNKPGSMIKRIINKADLGYCLEEAESDKYYEEAKEWLLDKYLEFIETGRIVFEPKEGELEKYSSEKMARRFGKIIEKCCVL